MVWIPSNDVTTVLLAISVIATAACSKTSSGVEQRDRETAHQKTARTAQPKTVTVRASCCASSGTLLPATLQRIVAWRKGDVRIGRYGMAEASLKVSEVLEGTLRDPHYASRPVGVNALEVVIINDANIALEAKKDSGETPKGPAVVYPAEGRRGVFLALLDPELRMRRLVQVNDPATEGFRFIPQVAVNKETLCVAWRQGDNQGDRLFVRTFDLAGEPLSAARVVADSVGEAAGPIPAGAGYAVAWSDETFGEIRAAAVSSRGTPGTPRLVMARREGLRPIDIGWNENELLLLTMDRTAYPFRLLAKATPLDGK